MKSATAFKAALMLLSVVAFAYLVANQAPSSSRRLTLNSITPEMRVLANVADRQILHTLFLSLDYDESNNTIAGYAQQQRTENPDGNLVVMAEGLGPLFPLVRPGSWMDWTTLMLSRLSRPIWQGKFLEFPNPDFDTKGSVKFINQYVGLEGWTGHVYPGTIQEATNMVGRKQLDTIVPAQPMVTLDEKPSLILDYSLGANWRTNVMDECRPLSRDKLVAASVHLWADTTTEEEWGYVWLCRGTSPRFFQLGGERVFFLFFLLQIMPDSLQYNVTM